MMRAYYPSWPFSPAGLIEVCLFSIPIIPTISETAMTVLIQAPPPSTDYLGIVSDRQVLSWFFAYAEKTPSFLQILSNSLQSLRLPSLNLYSAVVALKSSCNVLDAMKLMSEQGVSSVAVVEEEKGTLLSAVSVTDIGKVIATLPVYVWDEFKRRFLACCPITKQSDPLDAAPPIHLTD